MIVFLDRDGVINRFPGNGNYVTRVSDFKFIPGSLEAIRLLTKEGFNLFVISNQAGVGKGLFTQEKLDQITEKMLMEIRKKGGRIKKVCYSTSRPGESREYRKPNIGLIRDALKSVNRNLTFAKNAFFVGDTETDIQTGKNAGCKTIFVLSGREDHNYLRLKWKAKPNYIARDLLQATRIILAEEYPATVLKKKTIKAKKKRKTFRSR